jgi:hypothetical protein
VHRSIVQFGDVYVDTWPEAMTVAALGALGLFAAPWLARAAAVDVALVRALLGPTRLVARVESLEETRALAVDDTAATLRRIERDLHDGAQARLVALAMHLDMAREELVGDAVDAERVGRARTLVGGPTGTRPRPSPSCGRSPARSTRRRSTGASTRRWPPSRPAARCRAG